ncbi:MAG TPA: hypothetical protein VF669_22460 [Tepidisphaeraceae bacterium]|jgi:hypothetical protein
MSCWVVPSIAAEFWGTSIESVLKRMQTGEIPHRLENGWTFVDVLPDGAAGNPADQLAQERPQTFTVVTVTEEELDALTDDEPMATPEPEPEPVNETPQPVAEEVERELEPEAEQEASTFGNWRTARKRTSRLRVAPPRFATV